MTTQIGNLKVSATAEFEPRAFPEHGTLPAQFGSIVRIRTVDGDQPPALKTLIFEFDKHGKLNFKGVPTCTLAKLEGTTPDEARKRLRRRPGRHRDRQSAGRNARRKPAFTLSSPISIFNAPPEGGMPTLIAHAYETVPSPQALITQFKIERIHHGRYGYRTEIELPAIAGGDGAAILAEAKFGRTYKRGGREVGYVEAECSGGRLQVYGKLRIHRRQPPAVAPHLALPHGLSGGAPPAAARGRSAPRRDRRRRGGRRGEVETREIRLEVNAAFQPRALPAHSFAPVTSTASLDIAKPGGGEPLALEQIVLDFDRDGRLDVAGLPTCAPERIAAARSKKRGRICKGAIVGTGKLEALVAPPLRPGPDQLGR